MVFIKKGTIAAAFVMATMCFGSAAYAQDATAAPDGAAQEQTQDYSEDDLQKFVEANTAVTEIQKASRDTMVAVIEKNSLTLDRFNELAKAHRSKKLEEVAENPDEIAAFSNAAQEVVKLQPETKDKIQKAIEEQGLTQEKYDALMKAYRENPEVQNQIRRLIAEKK
ncbi:DUF4168 domain-containing protein [Pontibacter anaerobius]|uniref:DUF4168 domain-containing protein n=1 Tax=Pontibacter anaerobius TaxID=2993940 RepID=A0ABT3RIQ5_9BACT|nr:DUF4168 domain-containing protein [Pontibacter anaerobius]MCX2741737.1 DUF4168 domain-containing protein [Pontibacter anaerobius]